MKDRKGGPYFKQVTMFLEGKSWVWTSHQLSRRLRFCAHALVGLGGYLHRPVFLMPRISAPYLHPLGVANLCSGRAEGRQGLRAWVQIPTLLLRGLVTLRMSPHLSEPVSRSVKRRSGPCLVLRTLSAVTKVSALHDSGGGSWLPGTPFLGLKRNQVEPCVKHEPVCELGGPGFGCEG